MKVKYIAVVLLLLTLGTAQAQEYITTITYNTAMPMGEMDNFIGKYSWKGFAIEGRRFLNRDFSVGGSFGWNIFDEKTDELLEFESGAASGTQIRYVNSFPIVANAHYYIGKRRNFRAYVGLNAGVYYIYQRFDMGVRTINNNNWHFGFAPEVGFLLPVGEVQLTLNIKYNYALDSGSRLNGDSNNDYQYLGINLGVAFSY